MLIVTSVALRIPHGRLYGDVAGTENLPKFIQIRFDALPFRPS